MELCETLRKINFLIFKTITYTKLNNKNRIPLKKKN